MTGDRPPHPTTSAPHAAVAPGAAAVASDASSGPGAFPARLVIITGPTAVGKSHFTLQLAEELGGEIVSADSVQVYRGLSIGSAKPSLEEQQRVPHHLVDICDPDQHYDAATFLRDAIAAITDIEARGRTAIVAGGSNLYIQVLIHGLFNCPAPSPAIRKRHQERFHTEGPESLYQELTQVDPMAASRIHPNDLLRVSRALEIYELTGQPLSQLQKQTTLKHAHFTPYLLAFTRDRDILYQRINDRVDEMLHQGLFQEWKNLVDQGVDPMTPSLQSLGYRHMALLNEATTEQEQQDVITLMKRDTRRFAKRQLSWLRNDPLTSWYTLPEDELKARDAILAFIEKPHT